MADMVQKKKEDQYGQSCCYSFREVLLLALVLGKFLGDKKR